MVWLYENIAKLISKTNEDSRQKALVNTCHFKGKYPDSCIIESCTEPVGTDFATINNDWQTNFYSAKVAART